MNETQVAGLLRNVVEKVYEKVDDVDNKAGTLFGQTALVVGGLIESAKQLLVEADKALADFDKTEEVNLGATLSEDAEGDHAWDAETKLHAIQRAADEHFGADGHLWWLVKVRDANREQIDESYEKLKAGTLFDTDNL